MSQYLDPKSDFGFKKLFADERNKDILIAFLNDMIVFERHKKQKVVDVEILPTNQSLESALYKESVLDVLCVDNNQNQYIVEMQLGRDNTFFERSIYYAAKTYSSQLKEREKYKELKNVYFLAILNFKLFKDEDYKRNLLLMNEKTLETFDKGMYFSFFELPKYKKLVKKNKKHEEICDLWIEFFTSLEDFAKTHPCIDVFDKAQGILNKTLWDDMDMRTYDKYQRSELVFENKLEEREKKGKREGKAEGKAEGIKEANIKTCIELLKLNIDIDSIMKATGLSMDEILYIKNK